MISMTSSDADLIILDIAYEVKPSSSRIAY